ncbi:hypothetical protein Asal01_00647 [Fodinibius salicampi]
MTIVFLSTSILSPPSFKVTTMPLYMDIHYVGEISVADIREAHIKDLEVQEKYGVTYHQYWYNKEVGTVFCLMEGPDKDACIATHKEAHGFTACNIIEVEGGLYDLFMGNNSITENKVQI